MCFIKQLDSESRVKTAAADAVTGLSPSEVLISDPPSLGLGWAGLHVLGQRRRDIAASVAIVHNTVLGHGLPAFTLRPCPCPWTVQALADADAELLTVVDIDMDVS